MSLALHAHSRIHKPLLQDQMAALRAHMAQCQACRKPWALAADWVERAHAVLAPRFVTTVVVAAGALAVVFGWL